jgi:hypothetical protein
MAHNVNSRQAQLRRLRIAGDTRVQSKSLYHYAKVLPGSCVLVLCSICIACAPPTHNIGVLNGGGGVASDGKSPAASTMDKTS